MKTVLLVDDSATILMMQKMVLKATNYKVIVAHNGEEGVRKATAERPDLILMDVIMPKMTGFEACRKLREQDVTKDIPIIMVTTRGEPLNVEEGFQSGCTDYVTKPIDSFELINKLKDQLGE